jgi:hypothetical protein
MSSEKQKQGISPEENIIEKIFLIRGQKVMIDRDLAELYGVETRSLNQAVRRNIERFPSDFMFELTQEEHEILRSQNVISRWGGARYMPLVFTEHGVAMLSSVLKSKQAVQVNIKIIRVFTKLRSILEAHKDLLLKIEKLQLKDSEQDENIRLIFEYLKKLNKVVVDDRKFSKRKRIGFKPDM